MDALTSSFTRVHELPRLKTLELSFYAAHDASYEDSLIIQWTILSAISSQSLSPSLTSLTINRLAPLYHPIYDSPSFGGLLRSLTSLSVPTAYHDIYTAEEHTQDSYVQFWEEAIQNRMLGSLSHNLTTLRLQGQIFVGYIPGPNFSQVNFPALESLVAKILVLRGDACPRLHQFVDDEDPLQWSRIWNRFARELKALVLLVVRSNPLNEDGFTTNSSGEDDSLRYVDLGWLDWPSYEPWDGPLPFRDGDLLALREFRRVVRSRAAEEQKHDG